MKYPIKKNLGFVELFLILPLLVSIIFVTGFIGFIMFEKIKIEKESWAIQTSKTYNIDHSLKEKYHSTREGDFLNFLTSIPITKSIAFDAFLALNTSHTENLKNVKSVQPDLKNTFKAANIRQVETSTDQRLFDLDIQSSIFVSGSNIADLSYEKKLAYIQSIWLEQMLKTQFGYKLLSDITCHELRSIKTMPREAKKIIDLGCVAYQAVEVISSAKDSRSHNQENENNEENN